MLRTSRNTLTSSLTATTANAQWSVLAKNPDSWLKSLCIKGRKQELRDGVDDVAGEIEDVEKIVILVPQILA